MSSLEQQVGMYAVNSLWEAAVVGGAGWLVSRLLKNFGPRAQHAVWVGTLLVGVVTPAIPMLRAAVSTMLSRPVAGHALVSFAVVGAAASRRVRDGIGVPEAVMLGIFVLFMVLAAYFALRLCQRVGRVARLRRRAVPVQLTEVMNREWARCREAFGSQGTELLRADGLAGPVTAGFWQPVVIVPDGFVDGGGRVSL